MSCSASTQTLAKLLDAKSVIKRLVVTAETPWPLLTRISSANVQKDSTLMRKDCASLVKSKTAMCVQLHQMLYAKSVTLLVGLYLLLLMDNASVR